MGKFVHVFFVFLVYVFSLTAVAGVVPAKVTFVGNYSHQSKSALIIQFDQKIETQDVAHIFLLEAHGDGLREIRQQGQWIFNASHTAVIYDQVQVGQRYRVRLLSQIQTAEGVARQHDVTIYERQPQVNLIGWGPVVPSKGSRTIPLSVVNADQLTVEVLKVKQPARFLNDIYYNSGADTWALSRQQKNYQAVTTLSFDVPEAEANQEVRTSIHLPESLPDGWYILLIKITGDVDESHLIAAHVLLTDIGIQARVYQQHLDILLNSLSGSAAITQAHAFILRKHKTIDLGVMASSRQSFSYQIQQGDILVIRRGEQMSVLPLKEVPLDLSDFQVTGRDWQSTEAFVYSNRTLFKPGDTVPLNIILRDQDGRLGEKQRLYIEYRQPDGQVAGFRWLDAQPEVAGFYQDQFIISPSAPLGRWIVSVKTNKNAERALNEFSFNVSEFVPERMDLVVDMAKGLQNNVAFLPVSLQGQYLFGAPAAGNQVNISASYQVLHHFDGAYKDFYVGRPFQLRNWKDLPEIQPVHLDEKGNSQLRLPLIKQSMLQSPVLARFNFELLETGGGSVQRNKPLMLWAGQSLPGVRLQTREISAFSQARFDIGLLSGNGQQLEAGHLQYLLERNRGGYYWTYTESDGWQLEHDDHWQPVQSDFIQSEKGKTTPLTVNVEWGRYRLTVKNGSDQVTRYDFWAGWNDSDGQLKPVKPDQLTMSLDKKRYQDGDNVLVTVKTDVPGQLYLSLESDKVEWHQEKRVDRGQYQFHVPLNKLNRHDLYISATLMHSGQGNPRRLFAVKPVKLDRESRRLAVEIKPLPTLLPLRGADVMVTLKQPVKEPTWVTLSLVDKGIINLSRYRVPDIHGWFFNQRRYQADVIDLYSRFYQQRPDSFLTHRYGGDAELGTNTHLDETVESKTITLMSGPVVFDKQGQAIIHVNIPDYNGQAQVVAMAFNRSQYGQDVTEVNIAAPIVSELAVPRFLAPGDTSQTLLEVFNQTDVAQTVKAKLETSELLSVQHQSEVTFHLEPGKRASQPFSFTIGSTYRPLKVTDLTLNIHATGSDGQVFEQQRSWSVPVRLARPYITRQTLVTLPSFHADGEKPKPSVKLTESLWKDLLFQHSDPALVHYAHAPHLDIGAYTDHLFAYPYGCAEQTVSQAFPWLIEDDALRPLKQKVAQDTSERDILKKAVMRLATMQKGNGSFALWNKHGEERPWISVYVTDFLLQAEQRYPGLVPEHMLSNALKNIGGYPLKSSLNTTRYYAAWVRAKIRKLDYSTLWQLDKYAASHKPDSPLSVAYLGAAWLLNGSKQKGEAYLFQSESIKHESEYSDDDYGSQLRDQARILALLFRLEKVIKLSDELTAFRNRLAKTVMVSASRYQYLSTQEQIALVEAGTALKGLNQKPATLFWQHNGEALRLQSTGTGSFTATAGDVLKNPGPEPLFIQITTKGIMQPESLRSVIKAKTVKREYRLSNGQPYHGEPLNMGDKLIVTVTYQLEEPIRNAMIVEYLPTGFVLENPARTNSNELIRQAGLQPSDDAEKIEYRNDRFMAALDMDAGNIYHYNYVIRAETPGEARIPALYMEDMYHPEWFIYQPVSLKTLTIKGGL